MFSKTPRRKAVAQAGSRPGTLRNKITTKPRRKRLVVKIGSSFEILDGPQRKSSLRRFIGRTVTSKARKPKASAAVAGADKF